jgi:hypothetical protein
MCCALPAGERGGAFLREPADDILLRLPGSKYGCRQFQPSQRERSLAAGAPDANRKIGWVPEVNGSPCDFVVSDWKRLAAPDRVGDDLALSDGDGDRLLII